MQFRALGASDAVRRPAFLEVRCIREMRTGIDVPVLRRQHMVELVVMGLDVFADGASHGCPAGHRQGSPFAEVVLDIDDDQGTGHQFSS